jgi:hypothetical protein
MRGREKNYATSIGLEFPRKEKRELGDRESAEEEMLEKTFNAGNERRHSAMLSRLRFAAAKKYRCNSVMQV